MTVYVVEMLRWGDRENHSYIEGVYDKPNLALKAAKQEEVSRGGKYEAEYKTFILNETKSERLNDS